MLKTNIVVLKKVFWSPQQQSPSELLITDVQQTVAQHDTDEKSSRYVQNQSSTIPHNPSRRSSLNSSRLWWTVSNAAVQHKEDRGQLCVFCRLPVIDHWTPSSPPSPCCKVVDRQSGVVAWIRCCRNSSDHKSCRLSSILFRQNCYVRHWCRSLQLTGVE